jgi:hypothetical protein
LAETLQQAEFFRAFILIIMTHPSRDFFSFKSDLGFLPFLGCMLDKQFLMTIENYELENVLGRLTLVKNTRQRIRS